VVERTPSRFSRESRNRQDAHARISLISPQNVVNRGLLGGEGWIRTPGAARAPLSGTRPVFVALFGPTKSIRAGENLFAWNSALLQLFPASGADSLLSSLN
jgi:hypothetical protein